MRGTHQAGAATLYSGIKNKEITGRDLQLLDLAVLPRRGLEATVPLLAPAICQLDRVACVDRIHFLIPEREVHLPGRVLDLCGADAAELTEPAELADVALLADLDLVERQVLVGFRLADGCHEHHPSCIEKHGTGRVL